MMAKDDINGHRLSVNCAPFCARRVFFLHCRRGFLLRRCCILSILHSGWRLDRKRSASPRSAGNAHCGQHRVAYVRRQLGCCRASCAAGSRLLLVSILCAFAHRTPATLYAYLYRRNAPLRRLGLAAACAVPPYTGLRLHHCAGITVTRFMALSLPITLLPYTHGSSSNLNAKALRCSDCRVSALLCAYRVYAVPGCISGFAVRLYLAPRVFLLRAVLDCCRCATCAPAPPPRGSRCCACAARCLNIAITRFNACPPVTVWMVDMTTVLNFRACALQQRYAFAAAPSTRRRAVSDAFCAARAHNGTIGSTPLGSRFIKRHRARSV